MQKCNVYISRKKKEDFKNAQFIVRQNKESFVVGLMGYGSVIVVLTAIGIFSQCGLLVFGLMSIVESGFLLLAFFMFGKYREEKIIVVDEDIYYFNALGKKEVISINQLKYVDVDENKEHYIFKDENERKLFFVTLHMKGADTFMKEFISKKLGNE